MSIQTAALLTNKEVIAVDQDPLGAEGVKYSVRDSVETWVKPLQGGDWAVCFLNRSATPKKLSVDWRKEAIKDSVTNLSLDAHSAVYNLFDLWEKKTVGKTSDVFTAILPSRDVVMLRLKKEISKTH